MIVNSDERQWTWMDEGLNSYVQYLTEQQWERNYPSRRGPANKIVPYMKGDKSSISPIMTNSESIFQFGSNAYAKPATALNILRETVMGRELFDFAFKTYANRWKFKHPSPADFFRTMEDASGVDLDWFWRGWFYTNDHVDIGLENVRWYRLDTQNPEREFEFERNLEASAPKNISTIRNQEIQKTQDEIDPNLKDFYSTYDPLEVKPSDVKRFERYLNQLSDEEKAFLNEGYFFYEITFKNHGGLVMPLIIQFEYTDGRSEVIRIPAEIWKLKHDEVTKVFPTKKEVVQITLDPFLETADVDTQNNYFPEKQELNRFQLFKQQNFGRNRMNPMQQAKDNKKETKSPPGSN